jgi:predicted metal-dependent hydrolase
MPTSAALPAQMMIGDLDFTVCESEHRRTVGITVDRDGCYRWGSLGKNGHLNIHWAAMQLPISLVDSVIVHELAHIGQPRHTSTFWGAVERAMPGYEHRKTCLAATGRTLWLGDPP